MYHVEYEICSIVFLLLLIMLSARRRRLGDFQSKAFKKYMYAVLFNCCLDVATCYTIFYHTVVPEGINYAANAIYLASRFILPIMLEQYIFVQTEEKRKLIGGVIYIPALVGVFMVFASYWTHWIFFFNEEGYQQGIFHCYLYINTIIYCVGSVIDTFRKRKSIKKQMHLPLFAIIITTAVSATLQFLFSDYMLAGVGFTMSVFVMFYTCENMVAYEDAITGALTRAAFNLHIKESLHKRISEKVFVLGLDNFTIINEVYGMEFGNEVMQKLVAALQKEYGEKKVFRLGGDKFVVVQGEYIETAKILDHLHRLFKKKWKIGNIEIELSACICLVHSGLHGEEDVIRAIDYAMAKAKSIGKGEFLEVDDDIAEAMGRRTAIEQAIKDAIASGSFEVHYQPIYDVQKKKFHSMEALARLNVPGYGYVSPEEFILIAEQNGTIVKIGMLVLEEACRFINEYDLKSKGIEFIEVNLSVVQCMQDKICESIKDVLDKYNIPPAMINLEITESAAAYSEELLIRNMARLSLTDITFSLDDYGSGYSNVNYLVDLPFSMVKVDKYIVWASMKKVSSRRVLENTIAMFRDINLKVVAEGIEDEEMMQMVVDMGANYLQGYFFSKPVPKEKLVKCLEEGYLEEKFKKEK